MGTLFKPHSCCEAGEITITTSREERTLSHKQTPNIKTAITERTLPILLTPFQYENPSAKST
jgi:hypothetical protein